MGNVFALTAVSAVFQHDIGIVFNGKERFDVEEYCVSKGWVKVPAGKNLGPQRPRARCTPAFKNVSYSRSC